MANSTRSDSKKILKTQQNTLTHPNENLVFTLHDTTPFGFTITRKYSENILFNTLPDKSNPVTFLVFKDQYLQLCSSLPLNRSSLFGFGVHTKKSLKLHPNQNSSDTIQQILIILVWKPQHYPSFTTYQNAICYNSVHVSAIGLNSLESF
jgi:hypothetical protein